MTQWTDDEMHTAMCLWEAWIELENQTERDGSHTALAEKMQQLRDANGTCSIRQAMTDLVKDCDTAWAAAEAIGYDLPFDWEFVPEFLAQAVNDGRIKNDLTSWWRAAS